jgi:molybdopterin molybdotransferase
MEGFFQLISSQELLSLIKRFRPLGSEQVDLADSLNRTLAEKITSPEQLPPFARSTMDGFAVRARNTFGCSESEPAIMKVVGEIAMGETGQVLTLGPGQACTIWTGGELPCNADAVVMVEFTSQLDNQTIEIFRPVAPGENVIQQGEDYALDADVLPRGQKLRPQDLGVLAGLGIRQIPVFKQPVVAIISTGDELIDVDQPLAPGKIRDVNSTTLAALVKECGGIPVPLGIIADDQESMLEACTKALDFPADMVLLSGGSSVGLRDFTLQVLEKLENSELLAHGVSIKPGKPTILAKKENIALFGLPGHVGSAIVVFHLFVRPLLRKFLGMDGSGLQKIRAVTSEQIPSVIGREDYVRVVIKRGKNGPPDQATPVYGKSGLLNPLVRADGLLVIDRDTEGLDKGEQSEVILFP